MQEVNSDGVALSFSAACERNKRPILEVLKTVFSSVSRVLEIGSGTGQHAVFFAESISHLLWQPTDTGEYLPGLRARIEQNQSPPNLLKVVELDVRMDPWPVQTSDAIFSANTLHFMASACVEDFFRGVAQVLEDGGTLAVYGPFKYNNAFTSESNARFDLWLKDTDPVRGVKDFEWIDELAREIGLRLINDFQMPANNQMLVWRRD